MLNCKVLTGLHGGARRSLWSSVKPVASDPILGLVAQFKEDTFPNKVNLAQGAYRTEDGAPLLLEAVRDAEARVVARKESKEYLGIEGLPAFVEAAAAFALGKDSPALGARRVASLQTLSGTGALRVCGETLAAIGNVTAIHLPAPSWGNHARIFAAAGLEVREYPYLDGVGTALDFGAMVDGLEALDAGSVVLLHAAAHNPSGVDPDRGQWASLAELFAEKRLVALFDTAYQGFASGDCDADAFGVRAFEAAGLEPILCQSFAKNMGLYGERVGAVHFVCGTSDEAAALLGSVKQRVVRPAYSSPPRHGAAVAAEVLTDPALDAAWRSELGDMARRIARVRADLRAALEALGADAPGPGGWAHITAQIGMFAFTGLGRDQVRSLRAVERVYLTDDGRASLAGLAARDVAYVAAAIKRATDEVPYPDSIKYSIDAPLAAASLP